MAHPQANVGAIDRTSHTLYASDPLSGTVSVINTATCNAARTAGCAAHPAAIKVGPFPNAPVINTATQTLYVPYGNTASRVAVVNAATCNATHTAGCGQAPAVVKVGKGTFSLAVSTATNTIYASDAGLDFDGDTVSVINGATCNGTDHSGCGQLAAIAKVGLGPSGVIVNDRTHTVYVANNGQVRHYIGVHAAERRELRKRGMNHIGQRPERPGWLRRQPGNVLAEPADTGELALECTH